MGGFPISMHGSLRRPSLGSRWAPAAAAAARRLRRDGSVRLKVVLLNRMYLLLAKKFLVLVPPLARHTQTLQPTLWFVRQVQGVNPKSKGWWLSSEARWWCTHMRAAGSQATGRSKAFLFTSVALLLHFRSIHVRMGCDQTCQKFGSQKKNGGGGGGGGGWRHPLDAARFPSDFEPTRMISRRACCF